MLFVTIIDSPYFIHIYGIRSGIINDFQNLYCDVHTFIYPNVNVFLFLFS